MALKIVLFVLHVLVFKDVFSYPARDYIFAYIPIEEFAYLTQSQIEVPAVTTSNAQYTDGFDVPTGLYIDELITYICDKLFNSRSSGYSGQGYSVYTPYTAPVTVYQPSSLPTVTILPTTVMPSPSLTVLPTVSVTPSLLPSSTLPLSNVPSPLATTSVLHVDQYEYEESMTDIDYYSNSIAIPPADIASNLPVPPSLYVGDSTPIYPSAPVTVPYYGTNTFSGMVPASGSVKIYGASY